MATESETQERVLFMLDQGKTFAQIDGVWRWPSGTAHRLALKASGGSNAAPADERAGCAICGRKGSKLHWCHSSYRRKADLRLCAQCRAAAQGQGNRLLLRKARNFIDSWNKEHSAT